MEIPWNEFIRTAVSQGFVGICLISMTFAYLQKEKKIELKDIELREKEKELRDLVQSSYERELLSVKQYIHVMEENTSVMNKIISIFQDRKGKN